MHGNRTVRNSEFEHINEDKQKPAKATDKPGFYNRKTYEPFTNLNKIGYQEDPFERKEDLSREDYAGLNGKILFKN